MSYSPMENVKPGAVYPSCLVTGGLHDPRVQYWEPAKFVAELRHQASEESGPVIMKMDMESGVYLIWHTKYSGVPRTIPRGIVRGTPNTFISKKKLSHFIFNCFYLLLRPLLSIRSLQVFERVSF